MKSVASAKPRVAEAVDRLLTPGQLAELLGVKCGTIYNWVHIGYVPHIKLGKLLRFRSSDILVWLDKKSIKGRAKRQLDVQQLLKSRVPQTK